MTLLRPGREREGWWEGKDCAAWRREGVERRLRPVAVTWLGGRPGLCSVSFHFARNSDVEGPPEMASLTVCGRAPPPPTCRTASTSLLQGWQLCCEKRKLLADDNFMVLFFYTSKKIIIRAFSSHLRAPITRWRPKRKHALHVHEIRLNVGNWWR